VITRNLSLKDEKKTAIFKMEAAMKNYYNKILFAVIRIKGQAWDSDKPLRMQTGWDEHAAFMDKLVDDEIIVLGGPLEEPGSSMVIFDAAGEGEIRKILERDNWTKINLLEIDEIKKWTILLQGEK